MNVSSSFHPKIIVFIVGAVLVLCPVPLVPLLLYFQVCSHDYRSGLINTDQWNLCECNEYLGIGDEFKPEFLIAIQSLLISPCICMPLSIRRCNLKMLTVTCMKVQCAHVSSTAIMNLNS